MRRLVDHIAAHPVRLIVTLIVPLVASSVLAVFAVWQAVETNKERDAAICAQVNHLKEDIYVTITDIAFSLLPPQDAKNIQAVFAHRFLPIENCERS